MCLYKTLHALRQMYFTHPHTYTTLLSFINLGVRVMILHIHSNPSYQKLALPHLSLISLHYQLFIVPKRNSSGVCCDRHLIPTKLHDKPLCLHYNSNSSNLLFSRSNYQSNSWNNGNIENYSINRTTHYRQCDLFHNQCSWSYEEDSTPFYGRRQSCLGEFSSCSSTARSSPSDYRPMHILNPPNLRFFYETTTRPKFEATAFTTNNSWTRDASKPPIVASQSRYARG